ncbi:peptidoglycan DD-metalloendopeptidase family protein [Bacillus sp. JCM 19034]|uniref:peptidoglycan DD-metalloendopeptidase family protein n=1 Tax=Bacillus sp. JCM 19034 TaxID=1481928 RepID=UPI000A4F7271|nr:peptidoglycan DD-metalloendopeptidase family protein [Bacillus sp. JCM 19034]
MIDIIKRLCIVLGIATFLGILFFSTTYTIAAETENVPTEWKENFIWPTVGEITDFFGTRDGYHYGIDIAANEGTYVVAVTNGVVSRSYYSDTYGNVVFINHDDEMETVYAHLHERLIEEGQPVVEGQLIGTVGSTGRSSGNHLHFEVHHASWNVDKSEAIDPLIVLSQEPEHIYASLQPKRGEAVPASSHQNEAANKTITVQKGDTLWSLANSNGVTIDQIMEWNELNNELIYVNQQLHLYPARTVHNVKKGTR